MTEGRFSEEHFTPILSSDEEEYDDYTEKDVEEFPELDFTDEQLKEAVSKLSKTDYEQYVQLRDQYLMQYRVTGRIQTFSDLVRSSLKDRYPGIPGAEIKAVLELRSQLEFEFKQKKKDGEKLKDKGEVTTADTEIEVPTKHSKKDQGVEKLTPFLAQTIKECIDISAEPDESLLIKVRPNVPLHQALTEDELDLQAFLERKTQMWFPSTPLTVRRRKIHLHQQLLRTCCTLWQRVTNSTQSCKKRLQGCWGEGEFLKKLQRRFSNKP